METNSEAYLLKLQNLLVEQFTIDEIKIVCRELDVNYEQLWGEDKPNKIWDLLNYLFYDVRLSQLLELLNTKKPHVIWPPIPDDFTFPQVYEAAMGGNDLESISSGSPIDEDNGDEVTRELNTSGDNSDSGGVIGKGVSATVGGDSINVGDISDSTVAMGEGASVHVFSGDFQGANITIMPSVPATADTDSAPLIEEEVRLDVATPTVVVENEAFDVAVAVRQPTSPPLSIADLTAVTSGEGAIFRTEADEVILYRIEVSGSGFTVEPESYTIRLRPNKDSRIYIFQLTPFGTGKKTIVVNAYQEDNILAAQTRIRVEVTIAVKD